MTETIRFLGIDYGSRRIGLSHGDTELYTALPLPAISPRNPEIFWQELRQLFTSSPWDVFVVGYPLQMDGRVGSQAREVDHFISQLERKFSLPVVRSDERLTSEEAFEYVKACSKRCPRQAFQWKRFRQKGRVDSEAAALILQDHLNILRIPIPDALGNSVDGGGQDLQP
ncbi:MAG: Holliday junction resolvase RuvX [Puniceicoccales bacterium]|jgi:putative Holliday junction resolvase|nr:Holliday junction resolvase RuvX [Puniceicoccales bacterium]